MVQFWWRTGGVDVKQGGQTLFRIKAMPSGYWQLFTVLDEKSGIEYKNITSITDKFNKR